jgi:hypothetical protein
MGLGCLLSLVITLAPRLGLLFIWLFTPRVDLAFNGFVVPLLGFIFLPFTTLAYVLVWDASDGVSGLGWLALVVAVLFDVGTYAVTSYVNRHRLPGTDQG